MRWRFGGRAITWDASDARARVMGVLNVTPDSFSDGGLFADADRAVAHALAMVDAGADLIDIGGESSRPGAEPVPEAVERARVVPVVAALRGRSDVAISVDTTKASVAEAALAAGADIVNDITALTGDPEMVRVVAATGAGVVLMHMRGRPATMQSGDLSSPDIVGEVCAHLAGRLAEVVAAGVDAEQICLDPGIGFGKSVAQNLELVARLDRLAALGRPLLAGLSRKSFLGHVTGRPVDARLFATVAANACAVLRGAHLLRVHDVAEARDAAAVAAAVAAWLPREGRP